MTAYVRVAKTGIGIVPRWQGGRMPLSTELGKEVELVLSQPAARIREIQFLSPLLKIQRKLSQLPDPKELLVEWIQRRAPGGGPGWAAGLSGQAPGLLSACIM